MREYIMHSHSITHGQEKRHNLTTHIYYQTRKQQLQGNSNNDSGSKATTKNKSQDRNLFIKAPKILLVEDTEIIQKVNLGFLDILGCKADLAKDGFEAIDMFVNGYDLILLDIGLPSKNGVTKTGLDVVKEIRRSETETGAKRNIIIALTAYGDTMLDKCMEAGCDDFYVKPLLLDPLGEVLQRWLPKHAKLKKTLTVP